MEDEHSLVLDVNAAFNLPGIGQGSARKTLSTSTPSLAAATSTSSLSCARAFFGIYDGHGGVEAATFVKEHLLSNIIRHPSFGTNPRKVPSSHSLLAPPALCSPTRFVLLSTAGACVKKAIQEAFLQTDREFEEVALTADLYCGTTALVVLLQGNRCLFPLVSIP
jgi:serine/threonine protein phosphatase PrpC